MNANGDSLIKKAEKKLKGGGFFSGLFSSKSDRIEEAVELYVEASKHFKIDGQKSKAIDALLRASELRSSIGETAQAGEGYFDAADLMLEDDSAKAVEHFKKAGDLYKAAAKGGNAGKAYMKAGEAYENDMQWELAAEMYRQATNLFAMERYNKSDANKCSVKVAELLSRDCTNTSNIVQAIKEFEKVAIKYASENLLRHSAKELFFKSCLLFLVVDDEIGMERQVEKSDEKDPYFASSYEKKFLLRIHLAYKNIDIDEYGTACHEFSQRNTLDRWKTSVLAQIKRNIEGKGGKSTQQKENSLSEEETPNDAEFDPF